MPFPSLYRARATHVNQDPKPDGSTTVVVYVPAVFGEESILISDAVGSLPTSPEMGWVLFQAGNPEFPVWVGTGVVGGGGGTGGTDEVWIGPDDPIATNPTIELWYDTDASAPAFGGGAVSYHHYQTTAAAVWNITHNLGFFPNVTTVDSSKRAVISDHIDYPSVNVVVVTFTAALGGEAFLS